MTLGAGVVALAAVKLNGDEVQIASIMGTARAIVDIDAVNLNTVNNHWIIGSDLHKGAVSI